MTDLIEQLRAYGGDDERDYRRQAASELSRLQSALQVAEERIGLLMAERTNLIETKREQIARLEADKRQLSDWFGGEAVARAEAERERDEAKRIIAECAVALGNGAFISPSATIGFMARLPEEIRLHLSHLREETK